MLTNKLNSNLTNLDAYLDQLAREHNVVGASLAVLHNNRLHTSAFGLLNVNTGVETTVDSLFQIGSISKVFTATLVMQLVDQGLVDLDLPVKHYLRDFHIEDAEASKSITVRHLLSHTSGMDGDFFPVDDFSGPSIASYVAKCHLLPSLFSPGTGFSYSNSAYVVAGQLVEVITGLSWSQAIVERIFEPIGMKYSIADPSESLRYRMAMGHVTGEGNGDKALAEICYGPLSSAPAGTVLSMSATDLIRFVSMHQALGKTESGESILSERSVLQMQEGQVDIPFASWRGITHWGLGWCLQLEEGMNIVSHDGATYGQFAFLRFLPEHNLTIALLTNSASAPLYRQLESDLYEALLGVSQEPVPATNYASTIDDDLYLGRYDNIYNSVVVRRDEQGRLVRQRILKSTGEVDGEEVLIPIAKDRFDTQSPSTGLSMGEALFIRPDDSQPATQMYWGLRLHNRV